MNSLNSRIVLNSNLSCSIKISSLMLLEQHDGEKIIPKIKQVCILNYLIYILTPGKILERHFLHSLKYQSSQKSQRKVDSEVVPFGFMLTCNVYQVKTTLFDALTCNAIHNFNQHGIVHRVCEETSDLL